MFPLNHFTAHSHAHNSNSVAQRPWTVCGSHDPAAIDGGRYYRHLCECTASYSTDESEIVEEGVAPKSRKRSADWRRRIDDCRGCSVGESVACMAVVFGTQLQLQCCYVSLLTRQIEAISLLA